MSIIRSQNNSGASVSEVSLVGQTLEITQTDGTVKTADLSKFITEEELASGFKITGGKVDTNTTTVATTNDIPVTGGPLSDMLNSAGIETISKDTDLQTLLVSLFTKELYPEPVYNAGTLLSVIPAPEFTIDTPTLVKVGTIINVSECAAQASSYQSTARSIGNLNYGYTLGNSKINETSIVKTISGINYAGEYTISRNTGDTAIGTLEQARLEATTINAKEGLNLITVTVQGPYVSGYFEEIPKTWYYSNLGNISEEHSLQYQATNLLGEVPTNSKTICVTGVYPVYATYKEVSTLEELPLQSSLEYIVIMPAESAESKHSFATNKTVKSIEFWNTISNCWENTNSFQTEPYSTEYGDSYTRYTRQYVDSAARSSETKYKIVLA